jgi:hypothetical protein
MRVPKAVAGSSPMAGHPGVAYFELGRLGAQRNLVALLHKLTPDYVTFGEETSNTRTSGFVVASESAPRPTSQSRARGRMLPGHLWT